jgi:glycosyltransferase involved in cell wall biosynthesis
MGAKRRTLLFLGRIHPKKGIKELLIAWSHATRDHPAVAAGWKLAIAGWDDGGHVRALEALAAELGLGPEQVAFPGPLYDDAKEAAFRHADAFVLPSYSEGLPMAVLEAWTHGLPAFITAECNLPEGFEQGAAVEVSTDPRALADVLARRLMGGDLRAIGENGRRLVAERFSWSTIVGELLQVYRWLARGHARPACVVTA